MLSKSLLGIAAGTLRIVGQIKTVNTKAPMATPTDIESRQTVAFQFLIGGLKG
jgi:hypothetical protein